MNELRMNQTTNHLSMDYGEKSPNFHGSFTTLSLHPHADKGVQAIKP